MERLLWFLSFLSVFAYTIQSDTLYFKPKTECKWYGKTYPVNTTGIEHGNNPCKTCTCCTTGRVKCKRKDCAGVPQPPPCGVEFHEVFNNDDGAGCCRKCSDQCEHYKKSCRNCTEEEGPYCFYPSGTDVTACCGKCGACKFRGHIVDQGNITDPHVAHPCEKCVCSNGEVTCENKASCPSTKLNCVKPVIDEHSCTWSCPNGPSCFKNDVELFANETRLFGQKFCFCLLEPIYWPLAVCGNKGHDAEFEKFLENEMCMKRPESPMLWNEET